MTNPQPSPIPPPTPEDLARDLAADLAVCEVAAPGPWSHQDCVGGDGWVSSPKGSVCIPYGVHNRPFLAMSRTALPAIIRRCHAAEQRVRELESQLASVQAHAESAAKRLMPEEDTQTYMHSACWEYRCDCHEQLRELLRVLAQELT